MTYLTCADVDFSGKRVLLRADLNVPLNDAGEIRDDTRLRCELPTIQFLLSAGAQVIVVSHLGRPKAGHHDTRFSMQPVADALSDALGQKVPLITDWIDGVSNHKASCLMAENVRFLEGEMDNCSALSKKMAALCDVFVMDAFATSHRSHASTEGIAHYAKVVCAGPLLDAELKALQSVIDTPKPPVLAIIGGSKVSTKIHVLRHILNFVDVMIVGGGIANTLLAAQNIAMGQSLYEPEWCNQVDSFMKAAKEKNVRIMAVEDVVVADRLSVDADVRICDVNDVQANESIFDIGPVTQEAYAAEIAQAGMIVWNGPVGVFECEPFSSGTRALAHAVATSPAYSIAGGGDTLAALSAFNCEDKINLISTGGGAFLDFLQGEQLPAVAILNKRGELHE